MPSNSIINSTTPDSGDEQLITITHKTNIEIERFCPKLNKWTLLPGIEHKEFVPYYCATFYDGKLTLLGGYCKAKKVCTNKVFSFELHKMKCEIMKPTLTYRQNANAVEMNGSLYYLGGTDKSGNLYDIVECWNPKIGRWDFVAPLTTPKCNFAVAVFNGRLYVAGGYLNDCMYSNKVHCYDPKTNTWTNCASMMHKRSCFGLAVLNNFIYALGGFRVWRETLGRIGWVERYNPITDTWFTLTSLNFCRKNLSAVVVAGRLLAVGGSTEDATNAVEEYDPVYDVWNVQNLKIVSGQCFCIVVKNTSTKKL